MSPWVYYRPKYKTQPVYFLWGVGSLLRIVIRRAFFFALNRNAERLQKVQIVRRELSRRGAFLSAVAQSLGILGGNLVQPDRRLKHQQHIEPVFADILHNPGDLLALYDRLMNGLAQLLD